MSIATQHGVIISSGWHLIHLSCMSGCMIGLKDGTEIPWKGGHYARLDLDYPDAFQGAQDIFETIGCITLMKRYGRKVTQKSVHDKLWRKVLKFKRHTYHTVRTELLCRMH